MTGFRLVRAEDVGIVAAIERQDRLLREIRSTVQRRLDNEDSFRKITAERFDGVIASLRNLEKIAGLSRIVVGCDQYELNARAMTIGGLLAPMRAEGIAKIRVGAKGDGGYVMLDDLGAVAHALSFGIGDNDSWDIAMAERAILVDQFDHTIASAPTQHHNCLFHSLRIASVETEGCETLKGALENVDAKSGRAVLKIDVEGDEWQIFEHAAPDTLGKLSQIVCEFHSFDLMANDAYFPSMKLALEKLRDVFGVVHVHANNSVPWLQLGGVPFPSVLEVTYANLDHFSLVPSDELFPTMIDQPNYPGAPDYYLGSFRWPRSN